MQSTHWQIAKGRTLLPGGRALVMGIVNLTPDSFSDGGQFASPDQAVRHALTLLDEGADLLDLGAQSTRPGAALTTTAQEEQQRLAPVMDGILHARPDAILSVDTFLAATARFAVASGAAIVNDVSGATWDDAMLPTLTSLDCGVILMHTRGKPAEWAQLPPIPHDEVLPLVRDGLQQILDRATAAGIAAERIVLDPGFGFGKRGEENLALLNRLQSLTALGRPLLAGLSRKGFLAPGRTPRERLAATSAANAIALAAGAGLLRVHDVRAAVDTAALIARMQAGDESK